MTQEKITPSSWKVLSNLKLFLFLFVVCMVAALRLYYYFDVQAKTDRLNQIERQFLSIHYQYIGYELQMVVNDLSVMIGHHDAVDEEIGFAHTSLLGHDTTIKKEFDKETALLCSSRRNYSDIKIIDPQGNALVAVDCNNGAPRIFPLSELSRFDESVLGNTLKNLTPDAIYVSDIIPSNPLFQEDTRANPYVRVAAVIDTEDGVATKFMVINYLVHELTSSHNNGLITENTTPQGGELVLVNNDLMVYPFVNGHHEYPVPVANIIGAGAMDLFLNKTDSYETKDSYLNRIKIEPQKKLAQMLLARDQSKFNTVSTNVPLEWNLISITSKQEVDFGWSHFWIKALFLVPFFSLLILPIGYALRRSSMQQILYQDRLNEQRGFLITMLDSMNDAVIATNLNGRIQTINPSVTSILGYTTAELLNRDIGPILPLGLTQNVESSQKWLEDQSQSRTSTFTYDCIHLNGTYVPVELTISRSIDTENPFYLLVFRNMTEQREVESEMKNLHQKYIHREKLAEVGLLVGGILHEVSNPLAAIHGLLSTLLYTDSQRDEANFDEKTREYFTTVFEHIERVRGLSYEVSSFLKPTSNEMALTDLNSVIHTTANLIRFDQRWGDIDLKIDLDRNLPAIKAIGDQLVQVIMNLLLNAADACDGVTDRKALIILKTHYQNDMALLTVQDNGNGMSEETVRKIFQPFFTTKGEKGGTGLGMPLCEGIINDHGGYIDIVSTPNKGTTISCYLPVHKDS